MATRFFNILVPVDFTGKSKWAIAKAIEWRWWCTRLPAFSATSNPDNVQGPDIPKRQTPPVFPPAGRRTTP